MSIPHVRVGDLAEQVRGVSYSKHEAANDPRPGYVPILRAGNITDDGLTFQDLVFVPQERLTPKQRLKRGDVLIATSSGSLDVVGKAGSVLADFDGGFGAFCKVLRPNKGVHAPYFAHFFKTKKYRQRVSALAAGANINNLKNEHLDDLQIPLPAIQEQRRVAELLDKAESLRAQRRAAVGQLESLATSTFLEVFGDPVHNSKGWANSATLGDVADIASGITKGRRLTGKKTRVVPYLAVANVHDRALKLDAVKQIEATDDEIERYRLCRGDLLLTEGGDPDKLGRGTLWNNELAECIHQNHIFRVRVTSSEVEPLFLNWLVGSERGKRYFLRSAKQTTGIASINMTQLRGFPLLLPPVSVQQEFARQVAVIERMQALQRASLAGLDALFASLQQRAFSEL